MSSTQYQKIWDIIIKVPKGSISSYGRIADMAGLPRRARLVGSALKDAPKDMKLPWHRILNADGRIAFPADSRLYKLQKERLMAEGIIVNNGRVDLKKYLWQQDNLDALLWDPED